MFLKLAHTRLDVYNYSRQMTLEIYKITKQFPESERYGMVSQLRRAALSVHLNIAEGSSRKSQNERKRYYEVARGSLIEVDTAIGVSYDLLYATYDELENLGKSIVNTFKMLSGLIDKQDREMHNKINNE